MKPRPAPSESSPLHLRISSRMEYRLQAPVTLLLNFRVRASPAQTLLSESVRFSIPGRPELITTDPEQNRFDRLTVSRGNILTIRYEAEVSTSSRLLDPDSLRKVPPAALDPDLLPFLLPSRYCQSDRLGRLAWQKFGSITPAYDQVWEIARWIYESIEYLPGATNSATSAYDTITQRAGVCRDFAHLGIALCRALNIPARYFTGYAHRLKPQDFHACFEAFIGGHWVLFDPTRLAPPNGMIRIGLGRDAADVSVCTAFGPVYPGVHEIRCEVRNRSFRPLKPEDLTHTAISLE